MAVCLMTVAVVQLMLLDDELEGRMYMRSKPNTYKVVYIINIWFAMAQIESCKPVHSFP